MVSPVLLTYVPDPPPKFPVAVPVRVISPTVRVETWMFPVVGVSVMTIEPSEICNAQSTRNSSWNESGNVWVEPAWPTKSLFLQRLLMTLVEVNLDKGYFFFFAVLAESLKSLALGAPLLPDFRIFSPEPAAIRFCFALMLA
jgi:hypothetical protein